MTLQLSELRGSFSLGREAVFEQLYRDCFPSVARMVKTLGGKQPDAEDIFQECLIILYEKSVGGELDIESSLHAYVLGIARNLWIRERKTNHSLLELNEAISIPDHFSEPEPPRLRMYRFMAAAGRRCMEILQAFYYQKLSAAQLASDFGFQSARSATVQKHKCLEKVRNSVKEKQLSYEAMVE
jgi:RNA polymerase sigma factor (sigma-70 family)